jgi:hypothetical protein
VGVVSERVRELLPGICKENDVEILKGMYQKIMYTFLFQFHRIWQ